MAVCSLGCGREAAKLNEFGYCATCAGNIAGWSLRNSKESDGYVEQLTLRMSRLEVAKNKAKNSYVGQLMEKRRRRKSA